MRKCCVDVKREQQKFNYVAVATLYFSLFIVCTNSACCFVIDYRSRGMDFPQSCSQRIDIIKHLPERGWLHKLSHAGSNKHSTTFKRSCVFYSHCQTCGRHLRIIPIEFNWNWIIQSKFEKHLSSNECHILKLNDTVFRVPFHDRGPAFIMQ